MPLVHRLVAQAFIPNTHNKRFINHKDGDKSNNLVSNLEWVTSSENRQHAMKVLGKSITGVNNPNSKLKANQIGEIAKLFLEGWNDEAIASLYPVSRGHINRIRNKKAWL